MAHVRAKIFRKSTSPTGFQPLAACTPCAITRCMCSSGFAFSPHGVHALFAISKYVSGSFHNASACRHRTNRSFVSSTRSTPRAPAGEILLVTINQNTAVSFNGHLLLRSSESNSINGAPIRSASSAPECGLPPPRIPQRNRCPRLSSHAHRAPNFSRAASPSARPLFRLQFCSSNATLPLLSGTSPFLLAVLAAPPPTLPYRKCG